MSRFLSLLSFISTFILITFLTAQTNFAFAEDNVFDMIKEDERWTAMSEFCEKRSTDQINLETWYSGKCKTDGSSQFTGDATGFSDIVFLDLIEKVSGSVDPTKNPSDMFQDYVSAMMDIVSDNSIQEVDKRRFAQSRTETLKSDLSSIYSNSFVAQLGSNTLKLATVTPSRLSNYLEYVAQNIQNKLHPGSVYAASSVGGFGYNSLTAFLPLWKAFRNVVFILMSIIFVLYGFMIMFRVNIAPKISASISNIIPKIITTMLLVTFSYAIVGFVMDLMYFLYYVFVYVLIAGGIIPEGSVCQPLGCLPSIAGGKFGMIPSFISQFVVAIFAAPIAITNTLLGGSDWFGVVVGVFGLSGYGLVIGFVLTVAIVIGYFKLWVKLIQSLISLVISIIFAPLIIFMDLIPGSENSSGNWVKGVVGNASCFLVAQVLLTLSYIFMMQPIVNLLSVLNFGSVDLTDVFGVNNLSPGYLGSDNLPYIPFTSVFPMTVTGLYALIGLGILLMASKYVDMVRDAFKISGFKYGGAITESLQGGWKAAKNKFIEDPLSSGTATGQVPYNIMKLLGK